MTSASDGALQPDFGPPALLEGSLSDMALGMRGSEILRIAAEVRALTAAGRPVCNLTVGDFDPRQCPVPPGLLEATALLAEGSTFVHLN